MSNFVVLRTFGSRHEAEAAHSVLAGSGIEAVVASDDCGAVDPALSFARGVQLVVAEDDLARALEVMADVTSAGAARVSGSSHRRKTQGPS